MFYMVGHEPLPAEVFQRRLPPVGGMGAEDGPIRGQRPGLLCCDRRVGSSSNDRIGRSTPTIPRSDDNKDAMIRAIALSQKARKERRFRTYLWGDRRLGEVRSIGR